MKKWFGTLSVVLTAVFCCPITVLAGNINGAEQGILDAISSNQEYNGEYYRVTDGYKARVSDYLNRDDIDLSQGEADNYLTQFYANIPAGIASGYMEKTGDVENANPGTGTGTAEGGSQTGDTGSDTGNAPSDDQVSGDAGSEGTGNGAQEGNAEDSAGSTDGSIGEAAGSGGMAGAPGAGTSGTAGGVSAASPEPQKDAQGNVIDNTTGSTQDGELEYTVVPMDGTMYVWDTEKLEVHAKAYKDSEVIGTIALGDKVSITGGATTGWAEIDFEGQKGYVSAVYLRTDGYMKGQGVEVEEEEPEEAEEPEAGKEENADEASATADTEENVKDYSDAKAPEKQVNLGMIAVVIIVILLAASAAVILVHRNKKR